MKSQDTGGLLLISRGGTVLVSVEGNIAVYWLGTSLVITFDGNDVKICSKVDYVFLISSASMG